MATIISGDTGIDKITDGSVVAADLASTLDLSGKTITLATDAAVVSKLSTASGSAPSYSARAWVNFDGTGTVAIRESGNVSSITDNGTGLYTINFTTAMPDANFCGIFSSGNTASAMNRTIPSSYSLNANNFSIATYSTSISLQDHNLINVAIFR